MFYWFMSKTLIMLFVSIMSTFMVWLLSNPLIIHLDIDSFYCIPMSVTLMLDKQALIFISTVSTVTSIIIIYSFMYLKDSETSYSMKKFLLILLMFVASMLALSLSGNMFWMMIGWDGLGISSFCLIIFYQNWKSFSSGMVTFMSNRMGDVLIIMCIIWSFLNGSTDSWMYTSSMMSMILCLGAYSKSAQLPYLYWLPQAMAAPTPVSALVHSSTLVTAGIFTVCRYNSMLSTQTSILLFIVSCVTIVIAGSSSLMEFDIKKVIALSTLCHISLMMMFSIMGDTKASLFHLMMHAYFKSMLFMIAGYIIHSNMNSQDIRSISESYKNLTFSLPIMVSTFSMMGFPFMSGFYSKELMMIESSFSIPSFLTLLVFMLNSMFSCAYSIRLITNLFSNSSKKVNSFNLNGFSTIFIISSILSTFMGGIHSFFMISGEEEMVHSNKLMIILLSFSTLGILMGLLVDYSYNFIFSKQMLNEMWKSNLLYKIFQKHFFLFSFITMWMTDEKGMSKFIQLMMKNKTINLSNFLMNISLNQPFSLMKIFHIVIFSVLFLLI